MRAHARPSLYVLGLPLLLACQGEPAQTPAPPAPAPAAAPAAAPVGEAKVHMKNHFLKAYEAKDAVVAGNFEQARAPMAWLATHDHPNMDPTWAPHVANMKAAAAVGAEATDLIGAGAAIAGVAATCGSCHTALSAGPSFTVGDAPAQTEEAHLDRDAKAHMARHKWGADRLWEGLVGPSEEAWRRGAEVLGGDAELFSHADGELPEGVQELAAEIHRLGARAQGAASPSERSEVYAELLLTCAACHATVDAGPGRGVGTKTP